MNSAPLRAMVALAFVYLAWGTSYAAMKVALDGIPIFALIASRALAAGAILALVSGYQRVPWPRLSEVLSAALVGVVLIGSSSALLAYGLRDADTGAASVIFACIPLLSGLGSYAMGKRIGGWQWVGTLLGLVGLAFMLPVNLLESGQGLWFVLAAAMAASVGGLLGENLPMPPTTVMATAIQLLAAGLLASLVSVCLGEAAPIVTPGSASVWIYLTLAVTLGGYLAYTWLLTKRGILVANSYAYVNPVVAMLFAAVAWGELPSFTGMVATVMVLGGALIVIIGRRQLPQKVPAVDASKPATCETIEA